MAPSDSEKTVPPGLSRSTISPVSAGILSIAPGMGQWACGRIIRGVFWMAALAFIFHLSVRSGGAAAPLLAGGWLLNILDAASLARVQRKNARLASMAVKTPELEPQQESTARTRKSWFTPDRLFLGSTAAGLGTILALQESGETDVSVTIMWPIALALFGVILAFSKSEKGESRKSKGRKTKVQISHAIHAQSEAIPEEEKTASVVYARALCGYCGTPLPVTNTPLERCPSCATRFRSQAPYSPNQNSSKTKIPAEPLSIQPITRDPAIASILSTLLPGSGQVYNGQLFKGLFVFGTCWLVIPWLFGILDAYVTAKRANTIGASRAA